MSLPEPTITTHDAHTIQNVGTGQHLHTNANGELKANHSDANLAKHAHKIHHRGRRGRTHHIEIQHHETGKFHKNGKAVSAEDDDEGPDRKLWAAISSDAANGSHHLHHVTSDQLLYHNDDGSVGFINKSDADLTDPKTQWSIQPTTVPATTVVANVTAGQAPADQPQPPHPTTPAAAAPSS